jgi:hypothetical protein
MSEKFVGKVEFLDSTNKVVFTVDPDSSWEQIVFRYQDKKQIVYTTDKILTLDTGLRVRGPASIGTTEEPGSLSVGAIHLMRTGTEALVRAGGSGQDGNIVVRNAANKETVRLDGKAGDIILANADCAEEFDVDDAAEPGTVLVLSDGPGELRVSDTPYDTRVAGVISGAGECKPGIVLGRKQTNRSRQPIALVGKVYCKVEADSASVEPGTLLTTSHIPGHAMAASDRHRAFGAVLGKALGSLSSGVGLLPVLVTLQ